MAGVFHEGELAVQALAGEKAMAERNSAMVAGRIMGSALPFLEKQQMAVLAYADREGKVWASMLFGRPGFVRSEDGLTLEIDTAMLAMQPHDPLWASIGSGTPAGMLFIDFASRRRIRINGDLSRANEHSLRMVVRESYPNCPKYITSRAVRTFATDAAPLQRFTEGTELRAEHTATVTGADVLFIGTVHPERGIDASHRGGYAGFVEVLDTRTLRIPDYPGNGMFNTLGNLAIDSRAGLTFPDFVHGNLLRMSGRAETRWNEPDDAGLTGGTRRFLCFHVERWSQESLPAGVQSEFFSYSPFNPAPIQAHPQTPGKITSISGIRGSEISESTADAAIKCKNVFMTNPTQSTEWSG